MIEKDLQPVYQAMIKTTYVPIMRRSIVILLIHDLDRLQSALNLNDADYFNFLQTSTAKNKLFSLLDDIAKRRGDIVQEILLQYGIHTNLEMASFYHEHFDKAFLEEVTAIKRIVWSGRYAQLDEIARTQPE